jgi:DNA ligase-1
MAERIHFQVLNNFYDRILALKGRKNKNVERDVVQLKRDVEAAANVSPLTLDQQGPEREIFRTLMMGILDGTIGPIPYHRIKHNGQKTMFIMIGTTGAGKSSYASKLARNIGAEIVDSNIVKGRPKIDRYVRGVVEKGQSVIVNATHPTKERREELAKIARDYGFKTRCIHIDTSKNVAQRRSKLHVKDRQSKVVYYVGAKYFKSFEKPGSECDKYNVVTDAGVVDGRAGAAPQKSKSNSILGLFKATHHDTATSSHIKRKRSPSSTRKTPSPTRKTPSPTATSTTTDAGVPPPLPMKAHAYNAKKHGGTYYVSEKLDGIRALYYGGRLYTGNQNLIPAPKWFLNKIPPGNYDGELYGGPGMKQFHSTVSTVLGSSTDPRWQHIQYRIFDDWSSTDPFSKTYDRLTRKLPLCSTTEHRAVCLEPHHVMNNHEAIHRKFQHITQRGGEGLMLRENAPYQRGTRTTRILKAKHVAEAEAQVIGFEYTGDRVKSLTCKWISPGFHPTVTFQIGSGLSSHERIPGVIKLGAVITVKYNALEESGKPRHGVYKGVRRNI